MLASSSSRSNLNIINDFTIFFFICSLTTSYVALAGSSPQDWLDAHNKARAEVGVPPITWDDKVAAYARSYANKRVGDCALEHSGGPYGENLAENFGDMDGTDAVNFWVSEKPNYEYESNKCVNDECGHYTQVVWQDSVRLGCAKAKCNNGWMFVICSYDPPGNIEGQRPYNRGMIINHY
ncbi:pathogenesis-related protein 1-like [Neltuma alba]|uniref:pathogenesis-related protein 1-like n=1 Tax=Neltuma alba TaxID=207710 RepID=UPI0010A35567|nr:pathogenesis-related protein 1-like [Prosopis alba]